MLHEKLLCYRWSLELADSLNHEMKKWPSGYGYLSDQAKRAISSVLLNCAEGNARAGVKERRRFFEIARASIVEVGACVDLMKIFGLVPSEKGNNWKETIKQVSLMFHALK